MPFTRRDFLRGSGIAATGLGLGRASWAGVAGAGAPATAPPTTAAADATPAFRADDWGSVRAQFRLAPDHAHFATFFIASHPAPVRAAIENYRRALDENPFVYKDIHQVMAQQAELVEVVARFDPRIVRMAEAGEPPED